ncbi:MULTISPECIES: transporter substrate-binding domain-containing protein [Pseudomonas]|uniref:transporter substrate-binding domain-containing protein n=1 Tax=Pseudomonas TaxID=286 RepID=UPI0023604CC6|nr:MULTISPECIES: transporter substrate-binding domain-containing protein [Pseudomonas]WJV25498.1 transporter substrate-binding domain-containing protein [Pseudomonas chlororaphis]
MRRIVFSFALLILCSLRATATPGVSSETQGPVELSLLSSVSPAEHEPPLTPDEWAFLRRKNILTLGVVEPGLPPFDISRDPDLKGITADVASLLASQLHLKVRVLRYASREQAVDALKEGQLDLLAGVSSMKTAGSKIALSAPYAVDIPAIYRRPKDSRVFPDDLAGMRIAFKEGYLDDNTLAAKYPAATFVKYRSSGQAMASTAFNRTDLFLGDSLSARYLINHSYFNYIKIERLMPIESRGFAFALREEDRTLIHIVNTALTAFGKAKLESLSRRWVGGGYDLPEAKLRLTPDEQAWMANHPVVSLAVNDDQAPVSFVDKDGNFNGMAADILDLVTQRTGLHFRVERVDDFASLVNAVRDGKADLSVISRTPEREAILRFSPPIVTTTYSLLTRRENVRAYGQLKDLKGRRLAIAKGHACMKDIAENYPEIKLVETATSLDSLQEVAAGNADAAVIGLILGRYYISKLYEDKLAVSGIVDDDTALGHFAMRRTDVELQSILSKVILDIPPEEMNAIASRWRPNPAMSGQTWRDHRQVIQFIIAAAALLVGIFIVWALYLRAQVAKRIASEKVANDQLKLIDALSAATPQPIYVRDLQGRLVGATHSYEEAVGASVAELKGKTVIESTSKFGAAQSLHDAYLHAIGRNEPIRALRKIHMNNEERWIDHWVQPFHDAAGAMQGVICGWLDVTEQQQMIMELEHLIGEVENAREQAMQSSRQKTNFLATMSHEIRTPLSAVIGTLELVQRQADKGVLDRHGIQVAHSSANGLLGLIGDVLDVVRIESGRLTLAPVRTDLIDLIESVALVFDGLARQKGLNLALELDSSIGGDFLIDPVRVKQILSNLVSNAIKFTAVGQVKISALGRTMADDRIQMELTVADTGIGISQTDQQRLFQPFSQVKQDISGQAGAGLGLAISRSLCELMGGSLTMRSSPGAGTSVVIVLALHQMPAIPLDTPDEHGNLPAISPMDVREARRLRVLVVDDYAIHRQLLCQQLEFLGQEFEAVESGELALELWRAGSFDIVITDCQMPGMKGVDLAAAIRSEEASSGRPRCMILGLTADAQREEIDRCLRAGMDECTLKPLGLDALKGQIATWSGRLAQAPDASVRAADPIALDMQTQASPAHSKRDFDAILTLTGGDLAKARNVALEVVKSLVDARARLQRPTKEQDLADLGVLAHQMLGIAGVLNDNRLAQLCIKLQVACREGKPDGVDLLSVSQELDDMLVQMHARYQKHLANVWIAATEEATSGTEEQSV